jgi:hypothetical protein
MTWDWQKDVAGQRAASAAAEQSIRRCLNRSDGVKLDERVDGAGCECATMNCKQIHLLS